MSEPLGTVEGWPANAIYFVFAGKGWAEGGMADYVGAAAAYPGAERLVTRCVEEEGATWAEIARLTADGLEVVARWETEDVFEAPDEVVS